MPKSDLPLSALDLSPAYRRTQAPKFVAGPINGFDTETADGRVFLLSYAFEGKAPECIDAVPGILAPEQIFELLTHREARGALNVWYNLDFDANSILSALDAEAIAALHLVGSTVWKGYEIRYIPRKALIIKDSNRHVYRHFDVSQFFFGSLDKAAKAWLDEGKTEGVETSRFELTRGKLCSYILDNIETIRVYAKQDAELAARLWRRFAQEAEPFGIPCGAPYSTGYLAEQTYNVRFLERAKPKWGIVPMQAMAWEAYNGGRFEIIERGDVGRVVSVDINSAYPNVLRNLPDPSTLLWNGIEAPSLDAIESAGYGFVSGKIWTNPSRPLHPFAVKESGKLIFPAFEGRDVVCLREEFLAGLRSGVITDYSLDWAWLGNAWDKTVYPFRWVEELYAQRMEYKRQGENLKQTVLKIILNSLYGKLAQITEFNALHSYDEETSPEWLYYPEDVLPSKLRAYLESAELGMHREARSGRYFNPFLAALITGKTRVQLFEAATANKMDSGTILLATDGLLIKESVFDAKWKRDDSNELGEWKVENRGAAFVVGCGIYELYGDDGKLEKKRTRGFSPGLGRWEVDLEMTLRDLAKQFEDSPSIPISDRRPLKIAQALYRSFDMHSVGKFLEFPKSINAAMDSKRRWPKGDAIVWRDLLEGAERSFPLVRDAGAP